MFNKSRQQLGTSQRWVIKIGSAMVTDQGRGLNLADMGGWVAQMAKLHREGKELLLVSSGSSCPCWLHLQFILSKRPT